MDSSPASSSASSPIPIPATTHSELYTTQRAFAGAVASSSQANQEIPNTSSSQPGTPYSCVPLTLLYSPSSITADTPSSLCVASLLATQGQTQVPYRVQAMEDKLHEMERETGRRLHPSLPSKLSCDHVRQSCAQCDDAISIRSSPNQEHVLSSQSPSSRIPTPPDKLQPTLSLWVKNMNRLCSLIDRLQELASFAPAEYQSRLLKQVAALRTTSKEQKERFMEFLQLSEDYANQYLFVISTEIRQQSSFLEKLERRLEAAKKLHGEAIDLKRLYESGTVAAMRDLRATSKAASYHLQTPGAKY